MRRMPYTVCPEPASACSRCASAAAGGVCHLAGMTVAVKTSGPPARRNVACAGPSRGWRV
jgi:hypothetical protein